MLKSERQSGMKEHEKEEKKNTKKTISSGSFCIYLLDVRSVFFFAFFFTHFAFLFPLFLN